MQPNFINRSITTPFNFAFEQLKQLKIPSTFYFFFLQPRNFEPNIRFPTRKTRNYQLVSQKPVADTTTEHQTLNNGLPKRMYQRNVLITVEDVSKPSSRGCSRCSLKKDRGESRLNYWRWQSEDWSVGRRKNSESLKESSSGTRFYLRMYASLACGSLKCDDNLLGSLKCKPCDITIYLWQSDTEKNGQSQRRKNKERDCVSAKYTRVYFYSNWVNALSGSLSVLAFLSFFRHQVDRNWLKFNYHLNRSFRFEYLCNGWSRLNISLIILFYF